MPAALANRFFHVELEPNLDDWREWALVNAIQPEVVAFVLWRPELLFQFNPEREEHAWPSPRTWEMTSRLLAIWKGRVPAEIIEGTVGKGVAAEFAAFLRLQTELPDLGAILEGRNKTCPEKIDLRYALVSALASRAKPEHFDNLLDYSYKLPAEFRVLLVKLVGNRSAQDAAALAKCPKWPDWARKHFDVVKS